MRLFGYYALHSFWNQLRKLLKTWVLVFLLVCGLIGGIVGYSAGRLSEISEETHQEQLEETEAFWEESDSGEYPDERSEAEEKQAGLFGITLEDGIVSYDNQTGTVLSWDVKDIIELVAFAVILGIFIYEALSADKNGSKIFLMADVNLLFSSPMKPQSVLLFRLLCQIGTSILATIWLGFQIPNLILNAGMSVPAAAGLMITWFCILLTGKLIQVFFYTLCSTKEQLKKYLTPGVWTIVILGLLPMVIQAKTKNLDFMSAAVRCYNGVWTRWIPIIGWLKGVFIYTYEENYSMTAVSALLLLAGSIVLIWLVWNMKADFYEDAMAKSEQTAIVQQDIKERGSILRRTKKERSDKLRRDSYHSGWGASVFFTKSLYNRFRFAPLGIFTKTTITYLGVTACTFLLGMIREKQNFVYLALALSIFVFYRAMGNPLAEDTEMSFFVMIPENMWLKLFYSLAAGTVNCALDLLPALVIGAIVMKANPLLVLGWLVLMLSIDFYGVIGNAFLSHTVPTSVGTMVKQIVLIMYIYFGLLPDALIVGMGLATDHFFASLLGAGVFNLVFGGVIFTLTPILLEPKAGIRPEVPKVTEEIRLQAKKAFSSLGFAGAIILGLDYGAVKLLQFLVVKFAPAFMEQDVAVWVLSFVPLYLFAIPIGILLMRRVPAAKVRKSSFGPRKLLVLFCICITFMYGGNLFGTFVNYLLGLFLPVTHANPLTSLTDGTSIWIRILVMVILAPVIEEFIFRKLLIDRMRNYGEAMAVVTSGLMFGLFHGNFSQFFYAAGLGLVFGYIYIKTGKLRYSIGFHMLINFIGSVLSVWLLEGVTDVLENLDYYMTDGVSFFSMPKPLIVFMCYVFGMIFTAILGLILLCLNAEKIRFEDAVCELAPGQRLKTIWLNPGMLLFVIGCGYMFVTAVIN